MRPLARSLALLCLLTSASAARAEEIDYKKLYTAVSPGVVLIYGEQGETGSVGTGSIIREDGLVVTNAHVILDHATKKPYPKLFIFLKPDKITGHNEDDLKHGFQAQWIVYSADLDLALLRMVDAPKNLTVVPIAADTNIAVGEATAAIGHPESGAKWSLTTGRIGGTWADFDGVKGKDVYQMETSVNRGNSGGPLLDGNGYLIGINTSIARRSADGLAITGVNFAIESRVVRKWIDTSDQRIAAAPDLQGDPVPAPSMVAKAPPPPPVDETVPPPGTAPRAPAPQVEQTPPQQVAQKQPPPQPARPQPQAAQPEPQESEPQANGPRPEVGEPEGSTTPDAESTISLHIQRAPPPKAHGYTSSEKPGRVLSGNDLAKWHAKKAFDELEAEGQRHKGR
jgi:serine protease Do